MEVMRGDVGDVGDVGDDDRAPTMAPPFQLKSQQERALIAIQFELGLYLRAVEVMESFGQHDGEVMGGCRQRMCTTTKPSIAANSKCSN